MSEDVQSIEDSLNNLLEQKKSTEVDSEAEKKRLELFLGNIDNQLQIIEQKYNEHKALAKSKEA